jgi:hypothetical protein
MDYGFKVSLDGNDVSTTDPTKLAYTSKIGAFKVFSEISSSVTFSNYGTTISIPHTLGYIPIVLGYYTPYSEDTSRWSPMNTLWEWPYDSWVFVGSFIDHINLYVSSQSSGTVTTAYKVFIVAERAL